jgi:HD-GYP domain-containing protein (c-di-GMP phosphodiesterase class II)
MANFVKVQKKEITVGVPLTNSIYNSTGELLLKKGRMITTLRQMDILLKQGHVQVNVQVSDRERKSTLPHCKRSVNIDIFDLKSIWLEELYLVFNLAKKTIATNFSYRLINLSLELQQQAENRQDALIAAFQLDHENHYGLIHALHCAVICEIIAKAEGIPRIERLSIIVGALTHDLGIIDVQDKLHQQITPLTDQQRTEIQTHSTKSYAKLCQLGVNDNTWLNIAKYHHERLDGSGYPDGLKGEEIPVSVKIMSIADIYTAIIRPTPFREEKSGKSALSILYREKNISLDARLIDLFIQEFGVNPPGSLVRLKNREIAVVTHRGASMIHPVVAALQSGDGVIYSPPKKRDTRDKNNKIVGNEPLKKNSLILSKVERLWAI